MNLQEFEGKETALLIDRYKYLDLYPCGPSELKAIGHKASEHKAIGHRAIGFKAIGHKASVFILIGLSY